MSAEKDVDQIDTPDSVKNTVPNHGYSLRKGDFAQRPMSIKKFLEPFDHSSLTNNEAGEKYAAYKASFARQQLEEFFERNKSYAWYVFLFTLLHKFFIVFIYRAILFLIFQFRQKFDVQQ